MSLSRTQHCTPIRMIFGLIFVCHHANTTRTGQLMNERLNERLESDEKTTTTSATATAWKIIFTYFDKKELYVVNIWSYVIITTFKWWVCNHLVLWCGAGTLSVRTAEVLAFGSRLFRLVCPSRPFGPFGLLVVVHCAPQRVASREKSTCNITLC